MRILGYNVPEQWDGAAVKAYLRGGLGFSARALAGVKFGGDLRLNGASCRANDILRAGDRLELSLPEEDADYPAVELPLDVAYEDDDFLIIAKPPGMPVHPSPGHDADSLMNAVAWHYRQTGQRCRIRPLYRLDKDTSGLVPIAKHRVAAGARLEKLYLAVCEGVLTGSGVVEAPIGLMDGSKIVRQVREDGQPSVTAWKAVAHGDGHTLLALRLGTGRTHQIRVHMAHLGHPLAGDDLYGGSLSIIPRQALHMWRLTVNCPAVGMTSEFVCPLPEDICRTFPWVRGDNFF